MDEHDLKAIEMALSMGKEYKSATLPADLSRGKAGNCYDHCIIAAAFSNNPEYRYVEGVAMDPFSKTWILHAWLTDGIHAFDPTWLALLNGKEAAVPTTYIGIEMNTKAVAAFIKKTKHKAVLANAWMDPELANKAITSCL